MNLNYLEQSMKDVKNMLDSYETNEEKENFEREEYIELLISALIDSEYLLFTKENLIYYMTLEELEPDVSELINDKLNWYNSLPFNIEGTINFTCLNVNISQIDQIDYQIVDKSDKNKEFVFCDKISLKKTFEKIINYNFKPYHSYQDLKELIL